MIIAQETAVYVARRQDAQFPDGEWANHLLEVQKFANTLGFMPFQLLDFGGVKIRDPT